MRKGLCLLSLSICTFSAGISATAAQQAPLAEAPATTMSGTAAPAPDRRPRTSRDALLKDEITGRTETDAFALLSATRPSWLRVRGASSMYRPEMIQVYVNGMRAGSIQSLRSIQANTIVRVEHLDGARATERFGADHGAGAILLTTM